MKQWKTRLAICLCLLLAAPTVISALPVNKLEAEAASGTSTNVYGYYTDIQVEPVSYTHLRAPRDCS